MIIVLFFCLLSEKLIIEQKKMALYLSVIPESSFCCYCYLLSLREEYKQENFREDISGVPSLLMPFLFCFFLTFQYVEHCENQ